MNTLEEQLQAVLSDPETMAQVMDLAKSLNLGSAVSEPASAPPANTADSSGLSGLLGSVDPDMLLRLMPLLGELTGGGDDQRVQLLYALRPFLKPQRQEKIDRAVQAAKLIRVGRKLLQTMGEQNV